MATQSGDLRARLEATAAALSGVTLRLPFEGDRDGERRRLLSSIEEFLLPRVGDESAPVVATLIGLSGTGKSTMLNSLAQRRLSVVGPVRPTTEAPVLWAHRRHAARYWQEFIAAVMERAGPNVEVVLDDDALVTDVTIVDTPAPGVGSTDARSSVEALLNMSDLAIFVASAARYADAAAWDLMQVARSRGMPILHVLNRLPAAPETTRAISEDYARRLAADGYLPRPDPTLLFMMYEASTGAAGDSLPASAVAGLRKELEELVDPSFRRRLLDQTQRGVLAQLSEGCARLLPHVAEEEVATRELLAAVEAPYRDQAEAVKALGAEGRLAAADRGTAEIADAVTRRAGIAAQAVASAWSGHPLARRLLDETEPGLWRHGPDTRQRAEEIVSEWEKTLQRLVLERSRKRKLRGRRRRALARQLRDGAVAERDGVGSKKLDRAFGREGVVAMVRTARNGLANSLREVLETDRDRFVQALSSVEGLARLHDALQEHGPAFAVEGGS